MLLKIGWSRLKAQGWVNHALCSQRVVAHFKSYYLFDLSNEKKNNFAFFHIFPYKHINQRILPA